MRYFYYIENIAYIEWWIISSGSLRDLLYDDSAMGIVVCYFGIGILRSVTKSTSCGTLR